MELYSAFSQCENIYTFQCRTNWGRGTLVYSMAKDLNTYVTGFSISISLLSSVYKLFYLAIMIRATASSSQKPQGNTCGWPDDQMYRNMLFLTLRFMVLGFPSSYSIPDAPPPPDIRSSFSRSSSSDWPTDLACVGCCCCCCRWDCVFAESDAELSDICLFNSSFWSSVPG